MKTSQLKQLIKEEIVKILNENLVVTEPGRYLVDYIASEMDGGPSHPDSTVITLEPFQLQKLNPEFPIGFWKDRVEDMTGNIPYKITSVTKA